MIEKALIEIRVYGFNPIAQRLFPWSQCVNKRLLTAIYATLVCR